MSIIQTILETANINRTLPLPLGGYYSNGTLHDWSTTNATHQTYGSITFPNGTKGNVQRLSGQEYLLTQSLGSVASVNINLWFYPTDVGKILISELSNPYENAYYHYTMLEINSSGNVLGRVWQMTVPDILTSVGTVTVNAWNHLYFYYNSSTGMVGMSLNNATAVTFSFPSRNAPAASIFGIGVVDDTYMQVNARYQGKFDTLTIDTSITGSNYSTTVAKYTSP